MLCLFPPAFPFWLQVHFPIAATATVHVQLFENECIIWSSLQQIYIYSLWHVNDLMFVSLFYHLTTVCYIGSVLRGEKFPDKIKY
jgi:hypothetical protein